MSHSEFTIERTTELSPPGDACPLSLIGGPLATGVALPRRRIFRIGTRHDCDLQLPDPAVSARHACIEWVKDHYVVCDLGSTNGTWLDGVRINRARLYPGARLVLGRSCFEAQPRTRARAPRELPPHEIVGHSPRLRAALGDLHKLAQLRLPVLLRGETGTGKELFARTLHAWSPRADGPFIELNCAAIPEELAESELFGHVKGAFTGAHRDHEGAFARAHAGTLFLDEIGELPLVLQAKLLRVLETGEIRRVGDELKRGVDVRVVAATHRDLESMVRHQTMREDLYHRLGVLVLRIPALRERRDDIPVLAEHFAQGIAGEMQRPVHITAEALDAAKQAPWHGNVRALRNAVQRAAALTEGRIGRDALLGHIDATVASAGATIEVPRGSYAAMKRALVERVVAEEGSIRRAAVVLGIPRSTLGAWLKP